MIRQKVKDRLIEYIDKSNINKLFTLKKTSEIMTALTKDTWNQSIVLFISFLFDIKIIYKEKEYHFNKEINKGELTITI